jgi:hypothetical protein
MISEFRLKNSRQREKWRDSGHGGGGYLTAAARRPCRAAALPVVRAADGRRALLLAAAVSREGDRGRQRVRAVRSNYFTAGAGISPELHCCHCHTTAGY